MAAIYGITLSQRCGTLLTHSTNRYATHSTESMLFVVELPKRTPAWTQAT